MYHKNRLIRAYEKVGCQKQVSLYIGSFLCIQQSWVMFLEVFAVTIEKGHITCVFAIGHFNSYQVHGWYYYT